MSGDPYIDSLKSEIVELHRTVERLRLQLEQRSDHTRTITKHLIDAIQLVNDNEV